MLRASLPLGTDLSPARLSKALGFIALRRRKASASGLQFLFPSKKTIQAYSPATCEAANARSFLKVVDID